MSVQPSRARWPTKQFPTMPAPITTTLAAGGTTCSLMTCSFQRGGRVVDHTNSTLDSCDISTEYEGRVNSYVD